MRESLWKPEPLLFDGDHLSVGNLVGLFQLLVHVGPVCSHGSQANPQAPSMLDSVSTHLLDLIEEILGEPSA